LHRSGYRHLTGIDASHGMLVQAARKGIYRQLCRMVLGRPLAFADQTFDGLAAAGVFSTGPVPPESLLELDRILRPGGGIVFSLPWDGNSETMFLEILQKLEARGRWRREEASDPYASWPRHDPALQARVLAYRVL
jgi:ubiquinone/menaquinone biosynthesis C-methylase UbiE